MTGSLGPKRHKKNYISPIVWPKIPLCTYNLSRHPCLESNNLIIEFFEMVIQIVLTFIASEINFTHLTFGCEGSVTAFRLLCCVVICLLRLALFANVYPHFLQSNGVSVSNSDCWSSLTIDLICSVTNSCSASSLTFRWKSWRIVSTCFLSSSTLQRVRKSWLNLPSSLPVLQIDLAI